MSVQTLSDHLGQPLVIPGYRLLKPLGQGGMATVYLAVQESVDRQVALKVMAPELARRDKTYGERFLREARIVAKLVDPHIVTIYDVGISDGLHYLAMEYVPGNDLRANRAAMTLRQCLIAVKQVAQALEHAHHQGYVHRDIKPENILIHRHNGRAVLTDFGIAKPVGADDEHHHGGALGTPSFMSPEQALNQPLDHRSDLYSLGIVSYFLLTGQVPFTGDSPVVVSMKHALDAIPRLPPALAKAQVLIDRALAKHPDQRFQSGQQFAHAIDALLAQLSDGEEHFWKASQQHGDAPEATQLSLSEATRVPASAMTLSAAVAVLPSQQTTEMSSERTDWFARITFWLGEAGQWFAVLIQQVAHWLWQQWLHVLPMLGRGGNWLVRQAQQLWANRAYNGLPLFTGIAAMLLLIGWWAFSDDWNRKRASEAYRAGDLTEAEYNEILVDLRQAHQKELAALREALEEEDLTLEEYRDAVKKAKQEYTGEADCGSWFGC